MRTARLPDVTLGGLFSDGDWVETKDQDPDGDVRLVQLADIGVGTFRNRSHRFLTNKKAAELGCTFLQRGDILIARMPDPLGRACIFPGDAKPAVTAVDVCIVRPNPELADSGWLMWMLNAPQFRSRVNELQRGTTRKRISRRNLATIDFPLPSSREQLGVLEELEKQFSRLDAAANALTRAASRARIHRSAVLEAAIAGRLVAPGESRPQAGWQWETLADIAAIQGGIQKQPKRRPASNHYPYLRVANVLRGRLDLRQVHRIELFDGELDKYRLHGGDLLIVEGNGSRAQIGRMAVWGGELEDCVHQNHIIRARLRKGILPGWVQIYWNSPTGHQRVEEVAASTSGLYTLSVGKVSRLFVPVPPIYEQHRISGEVDRRLSFLDDLKRQLDVENRRIETIRGGILARAFSGELVPSEVDAG